MRELPWIAASSTHRARRSTNRPLATISIPTDPAAWVESSTCGSCHEGDFSPFVEQWSQSASRRQTVTEVIQDIAEDPGSAAPRVMRDARPPGVGREHELRREGRRRSRPRTPCRRPVRSATIRTRRSTRASSAGRSTIPNPDNNLCMKCHNRRTEPQATSPRGPHAPQGGVLLGTAGYWPAGFDTTAVVATHGNVAVNTRLCAGCHVAPFDGHRRERQRDLPVDRAPLHARPVPRRPTEAAGRQYLRARPADAGYVSGSRKFNGCAASGCHSNEDAAENAFEANRNILRRWPTSSGRRQRQPGAVRHHRDRGSRAARACHRRSIPATPACSRRCR